MQKICLKVISLFVEQKNNKKFLNLMNANNKKLFVFTRLRNNLAKFYGNTFIL